MVDDSHAAAVLTQNRLAPGLHRLFADDTLPIVVLDGSTTRVPAQAPLPNVVLQSSTEKGQALAPSTSRSTNPQGAQRSSRRAQEPGPGPVLCRTGS